jgi:hypothetical protein
LFFAKAFEQKHAALFGHKLSLAPLPSASPQNPTHYSDKMFNHAVGSELLKRDLREFAPMPQD